MTALVVNLGTSDLCIQVHGYYFPIGFNRREPNIDVTGLSPDEQAAWEHEAREEFVADISRELGIGDGGKAAPFRQFTEVLLNAYRSYPSKWHDRIKPGRFYGVVEAARRYDISKIFCIVTNQDPPYPSDTSYLYDLLIEWLRSDNYAITESVNFNRVIIGQDCSAIDEDALLGKYYQLLRDITSEHDLLLISAKGGTPQMQTALKIQSMALADQVLFIEPILSVKKILNGETSDCKTTSYWNYTKTTQYQLVSSLLARFDFDGALEVVKKYKRSRQFVASSAGGADPRGDSERLLEQVLNFGACCLNLDIERAKRLFKANQSQCRIIKIIQDIVENDNYNPLLHLFTQAKICLTLERHTDFLVKLSSFCDEAMSELFKFADSNPPEGDFYRLNRFDKRSFLSRCKLSISKELQKLDYWYELRNKAIHNARGISSHGISTLNQERWKYACKYEDTLSVMAETYRRVYALQNRQIVNRRFLDIKAPYYIYSELITWINERLESS